MRIGPPRLALLALLVLPACGAKGGGRNDSTCPEGHRSEGKVCRPIFDDCPGVTEIPVLGGGCRAVGVTQCASTFLGDGAGGCEPRLPAEPCPPGTMEIIGNSVCQPVGVTLCAAGFLSDGAGGCDAILPPGPDPCPDGTMELLGDSECQPIGDCGSGTWGDIAGDGSTVYVDASSLAPLPDGSPAAPYLTVAEALLDVLPGGQVAIAAGDYSERLIIDKEVRLSGRCAALVTIHGRLILGSNHPPLWIITGGSGTTVTGVTLTGAAEGLAISGAQGVTIEDVQVLNTGSFGVDLFGESAVTLRRVVVAGATDLGVLSYASNTEIHQIVVRSTRPLPDGTRGRGIQAQCSASNGVCGNLLVEGSLVDGNRDAGISVLGVDATITSSVVRNTLPKQSDEDSGRGINAQCHPQLGICGSLQVEGSLVERNRTIGIFAGGVETTITTSVVRDTLPQQRDQAGGRGINVQCHFGAATCGSLRVESSLIAGNRDLGIFAEGVVTTVISSLVRDTLPQQSDQRYGRGINAECDPDLGICGSLYVEGSLIDGNRDAGIFAGGVKATITTSVVRNTLPQQRDQSFGRGISAQCGPDLGVCSHLLVADSLVDGNRDQGIATYGVEATVTSSVVRNTLPQSSDQAHGRGISAQCFLDLNTCGSLLVEGSLVVNNREVGIFAGGVDATVNSSVVHDTLPQQSDRKFGGGIAAQCDAYLGLCGSLRVESSLVTGSRSAGIYISGVGTELVSLAVIDTASNEEGNWAGKYGEGIFASCDENLAVCARLEMTNCLVRSSVAAGLALHGFSGFMESSLIQNLLPRPLDGAFGYGVQVEGIPGAPRAVFDVTGSQILDASLAGILYYLATGRVSSSVVAGGDFAVVYNNTSTPPTITNDNDLTGSYVDGLSQQDLEPAPAPEPATPVLPL